MLVFPLPMLLHICLYSLYLCFCTYACIPFTYAFAHMLVFQKFCEPNMDAQNHLLILITTLVFFLQVSLVFSVVNVNSTLPTDGNNTPWLSPSGKFAFGFRKLNGTSTSSFSVAIWYNKIPDKTIVWHAKTTNNQLAEAPPGSQVQLKKEGLTLTSPEGDAIWTAQPADNSDIVSYGSMLDSGNFVLVNGESNNVWESFQNPTDTLLPNQSLQYTNKITSRFSETNYTRGRFQLYFYEGDILFSPLAWPSTYQYRRYYNILASGNGSRLVFNTSGDIYVVTTNGTTRVQPQGESWQNPQITLDDPKRYYYRATLDYYGVFTKYAHPRNTTTQQGWKVVRYVPDNICTAIDVGFNAGVCGLNSYCNLQSHTPTCTCLNGYSLVDPSNQFGGCQPDFTLVCGPDAEEMYELLQSTDDDVFFSGVNYEYLKPYSKEACQQSCLHDCFCAVAIYDPSQGCEKKGLPLINGRIVEQSGRLTFVKRRRIGASTRKENHSKWTLLGSIIGSVLFFTIINAVLFFNYRKRPKNSTIQAETNLRSFTYDQLQNDTEDFKEELGRGAYGIVYKGTLEKVVAVKKLTGSGQEGEKDFKTELNAIAKTCHKNLVRLIGFCDEGIHRMLVCEFMSRGTLANALFRQARPIWNQRVGFVLGIARGLMYLHEEYIIHCDINPQNILIDEHFTAKISDFGFAKLLSHDQSRTKTIQRGTPGYIAPEWHLDVPVTNKVDVYSFGVMLLEIICSRKNVLPMDSNEKIDAKLEGRIDLLMEDDIEARADSDRLKKWIKIAIWCIQENPKDRPTMRKVMQMLEGELQVPDPPIVKKKSH